MLVYISCLPKIEAQDFGDLFLIFGDEMVSSRCLIQRYSMILGGQAVVEHGDEKGPRDPIGRGGGALGLLTRRDGESAGGRDGLEEEC